MSYALASRDRDVRVALVLARAAAAMVLGWLLLAGGLVAARRLTDATRAPSAGELVAAALGLAAVSWGARALWTCGKAQPGPSWRRVLPLAATSSSALLWGLSLTRGVGSPAAVAFFWLLVAGEEGWALWAFTGHRKSPAASGPDRTARQNLVLQQYTRLLTAEGEEIVRGSLLVIVDRGSRMSAGHVAFCPPLAQRPELELQPESTTKATLKVSQLYPHGARIEVRLPQTAQTDTTVPVRFVARARPVAARLTERSPD
ncbi:MAG TPA: hypothetical protein VG826_03585 [Pirellulales bacterium]|nr:hypothetical protein [Pirellulales bacterium]